MAQSVYSWMGTDIHLILDDEFALNYNLAQDEWFQAQKRHRLQTGKEWDPLTQHIQMNMTKEMKDAWNKMAELINMLIDINGGGIDATDDDITSNYLVRIK